MGFSTGTIARVIAVLVLTTASFSYLVAQVYSTGIIMSRFLGTDLTVSCFIGLVGILVCSMLGGMKGVTWTQVAQYIVLIVAYLIPVVWMSIKQIKAPIPQFDYGSALIQVTEREEEMLASCNKNMYAEWHDGSNFVQCDDAAQCSELGCAEVGIVSSGTGTWDAATCSFDGVGEAYVGDGMLCKDLDICDSSDDCNRHTNVIEGKTGFGVWQKSTCVFDGAKTITPTKEICLADSLDKTTEISGRLFDWWGLTVCLMTGTASLPHVLMRYFTTPSVREARQSVSWSLFFIFLLYFSAPAYATLAKLNVYTNIVGSKLESLPDWVLFYSGINMITICGKTGMTTVEEVIAQCGTLEGYSGLGDDILLNKDFSQKTDVIVIATPEANGLPFVIAGLCAAGGLAASLSTADGLLLAIANSFSHDIYYKLISREASESTRLIVSRSILIGVAIFAAYTASTEPDDIVSMVAWAFSIAASGFFSALFLGVWWSKTSPIGAILGMVTGFVYTVTYVLLLTYSDVEPIAKISAVSAGIIGIPISMFFTVVGSIVFPVPENDAMTKFIDSLREVELPDSLKKEIDGGSVEMATDGQV